MTRYHTSALAIDVRPGANHDHIRPVAAHRLLPVDPSVHVPHPLLDERVTVLEQHLACATNAISVAVSPQAMKACATSRACSIVESPMKRALCDCRGAYTTSRRPISPGGSWVRATSKMSSCQRPRAGAHAARRGAAHPR